MAGAGGGCPSSTPDLCNGQCVDTLTSLDNCGSCGHGCLDAETCKIGECTPCENDCGPLEECKKGLCVAKLVPITGGYSIDATEVTRDQYAAWLGTSPSTTGQSSECYWNLDFAADANCMGGPAVLQGSGGGNRPQECVDWCDAYAYCKGVGKRLCGKIGGGASDFGDFADATTSQWFAACSSGGQNDYPYGDTYDGITCNGYDSPYSTTVPVASMSACQSSTSGYVGVYDLSGNVFEWEDSCDGNTGNPVCCHVRGGSISYFPYGGSSFRCDTGDCFDRDYDEGFFIGFRCCSSP